MNYQNFQVYFFLILFAVVILLFFQMLTPFIGTLLIAATFAVVFRPVFRLIGKWTGGRRGVAAILTIIIILTMVFCPLYIFASQILDQAIGLYDSLNSNGQQQIQTVTSTLESQLKRIAPNTTINLNDLTRKGLDFVVKHLGGFFSSFVKFIFNFFLFLISLYYFLKDGPKLAETLKSISPLPDSYDQEIISKLESAVNSVIRGSVLIAIIQGLLTIIGFTIFGVPNALLWGSLAIITALIPSIGTALISLPAILFLYFTGPILPAIGLAIWAIVGVGLIDNFLSPFLINKGIKVHPFLVLLSVLGGLSIFGAIGFLLGPLILSLLFALLHIYFIMIQHRDPDIALGK